MKTEKRRRGKQQENVRLKEGEKKRKEGNREGEQGKGNAERVKKTEHKVKWLGRTCWCMFNFRVL